MFIVEWFLSWRNYSQLDWITHTHTHTHTHTYIYIYIYIYIWRVSESLSVCLCVCEKMSGKMNELKYRQCMQIDISSLFQKDFVRMHFWNKNEILNLLSASRFIHFSAFFFSHLVGFTKSTISPYIYIYVCVCVCVCVCACVVSLFNSISTFMGYLMLESSFEKNIA